jgi:hypothetical protein
MRYWIILFVIAAIIGTIVRVELIYDGDYRCAIAECRIVKK